MVGIKDFEMIPRWCGECSMCREETIEGDTSTYCSILNQNITWYGNRVDDCPLVEAIPKANVYNAFLEMMKYEHEGFINISLVRLDEILKKCGVSEDGKVG